MTVIFVDERIVCFLRCSGYKNNSIHRDEDIEVKDRSSDQAETVDMIGQHKKIVIGVKPYNR